MYVELMNLIFIGFARRRYCWNRGSWQLWRCGIYDNSGGGVPFLDKKLNHIQILSIDSFPNNHDTTEIVFFLHHACLWLHYGERMGKEVTLLYTIFVFHVAM